jgi:hypothetical protein
MTPALLALCIYGIGFYIYAQASLDHNLPIYVSCIAGMTGTHHHAQLLLVEMGSC